MTTLRFSLALVAAAAFPLLAGPRALHAADAPKVEPVEIAQAEAELTVLEKQLGSSKSGNEDLLSSLDAVAKAYRNIKPLDPLPADATEEQKKAYEAELKKHEAKVAAFEKGAEDQFIKALGLQKVNNTESNIREDVAIKAAQILGMTGNPKLSGRIMNTMQSKLMGAKYQVTTGLWETAFAALGKLGDEKSLQWILDEFTHTKASPPEAVDQLIAAHKSVPLYKRDAVDGKLLYDLAEKMIMTYAATETSAEQSKNDPKNQAMKTFWDRIKTDAIRASQFIAGDPTNAEGQALATMKELQVWLREHKNPRKAPWVHEKNT